MGHTVRDKKKLLNRCRRIAGQLRAVEKALEEEADPSAILQTIAAARGAMNGLMAEVLEGHIRLHVLDPHQELTAKQDAAADELVDIIRAYLR